jgi:hypothetical protein
MVVTVEEEGGHIAPKVEGRINMVGNIIIIHDLWSDLCATLQSL